MIRPTSPTPLGPAVASRYAIRKKLGVGSMGTVYLAEDTRTKALVALKILRPDRVSPKAVARLQLEFRALASLHHPRIAAAHDFGYTEWGNLPYYTREYVEGTPLPPGPPGRVEPRQFLRPILDLLEALECLHAHDLLHLDVHAGNLIVADDASRGAVLIDFGLARPATAHGRASELPPELIDDRRPSPETDIYLAGRLLLWRLTGRTEGEVRLPREIPGWGTRLTMDLERIAAKALDASPESRFRAAAELREAIEKALGEAVATPQPVASRDIIVGRDRELEAIEGALRRVRSGSAEALVFLGAPGSGKTRLLREAKLRAQLEGLDAIEVRFLSDPGPSGPALPAALRAALGEARFTWLDALSAEHGGSPVERARRAARAYFAGCERPMVLVLDDLDVADGESLLLIRMLAEETRRLDEAGGRGRACETDSPRRGLGIIAAAARTPAGRASTREGRRLPGACVRVLRPFPRDTARKLLRVLLATLHLPAALEREALDRCAGSPRRLVRLAHALRETWGSSGAVPSGAELPGTELLPGEPGSGKGPPGDSLESRLLEALAVVRRPCSAEELAAATAASQAPVALALRRLAGGELVAVAGRGRATLYLPGHAVVKPRGSTAASAKARRIHARLVAHLRGIVQPSLSVRESLARHLLLAGCPREGGREALVVARHLIGKGLFERAARLLRDAGELQRSVRDRLRFAEALSDVCEETGDHELGISVLEPFRGLLRRRPGARETVRVLRRLAAHCHRAGHVERALALFDETRRAADPRRDAEDLAHVDAELAELFTLRGQYGPAEEACRRGLGQLKRLDLEERRHRLTGPAGISQRGFRNKMELVLRSSLGHLELRRMNLPAARDALRSALRLAGELGATASRAVILNNLGIAENQLNRFVAARRHFREAQRLLLRAGEHREVIEIACNLAVVAAKLGEPDEARVHLRRAEDLLRQHPGERLEFFVPYTKGLVDLLLGEPDAAIGAFETALPLGRGLGDRHLVRFGEVYLAEARILCGRYAQAAGRLRSLAGRMGEDRPPLLVRMAGSRLLLAAILAGDRASAERAGSALASTPRTGFDLLEAWNDLFAAAASLAAGEGSSVKALDSALRTFRRLRVPFGERLAHLAVLAGALARGETDRARCFAIELESAPVRGHGLISVIEPIVLAETAFRSGDLERARGLLAEASGAIVGHPFLELDQWLELLRSRMARRSGDIEGARRHLHRSLHTRDLLLQWLPERARGAFLGQERLAPLREAEGWLGRLTPSGPSTETIGRAGRFEGMVGRSPVMVRVFESVSRLRAQEIPVLIVGETGTGKDLVARALHATSPRSKGRFLALHCASLPPDLFEAELFGYEAGAFTGAEEAHPGILEALSGGTLLLDAVDELPWPAQAKLLRAIDSGVIRRIGSLEPRTIDVRFIAASSRDLAEAVREGRFRSDLYYRLRGEEIRIPPLRKRPDDIGPLARHFIEEHSLRLERPAPTLTEDALALLERQAWPGNVRELETAVLRALIGASRRSPVDIIDAKALAPLLEARDAQPGAPAAARDGFFDPDRLAGRSLDDLKRDLERTYIRRAFADVGGDLKKLGKRLGLRRSRLYTLLRKLGLDVRRLREGLRGAPP